MVVANEDLAPSRSSHALIPNVAVCGGDSVARGVTGLVHEAGLSDKEFSVVTDGVTNSYTIVAVAIGVGNATGSLSFSLTSALTAADAAKLVLHVDGSSDQFAFSVSGNPYVWPGTDLDWSSGDPVTLRLRDTAAATPPDAPTDFTATVGDAQVALAWKAARLYSGVTGHEFRYKTDGDYPEDWTAIAYSGPDEANENAFTVTGLTNEVAHTFELRAVNAAGGGDAATAEPVTPTPGICDRTQKIQDAILAELSGVDDCAAVTVANLASITTLGPFGFGTFNQGITSLQKGDFAGLTSLTILNLGSNGLTSLPEGIFSGLAELADLNLSSNQLESLPEGGVLRPDGAANTLYVQQQSEFASRGSVLRPDGADKSLSGRQRSEFASQGSVLRPDGAGQPRSERQRSGFAPGDRVLRPDGAVKAPSVRQPHRSATAHRDGGKGGDQPGAGEGARGGAVRGRHSSDAGERDPRGQRDGAQCGGGLGGGYAPVLQQADNSRTGKTWMLSWKIQGWQPCSLSPHGPQAGPHLLYRGD